MWCGSCGCLSVQSKSHVTKKVTSRLNQALAASASPIPVVVTSLPYLLCRSVATVFMTTPTDAPTAMIGIDALEMHTKHRNTARRTVTTLIDTFMATDKVVTAEVTNGDMVDGGGDGHSAPTRRSSRAARKRRAARRPGRIILFSTVDDRFDVLTLK